MRVRLLLLLFPLLLLSVWPGQSRPAPDAPAALPPPRPHLNARAKLPPGTTSAVFLPYQAEPDTPNQAEPDTPNQAAPEAPNQAGTEAITYDPAVVPPGATVTVVTAHKPAGVSVRLSAAGLIPRRAYGAHLHTEPCAALAAAAGPHYQHRRDPVLPSVDPAFANPGNEVWLDFTADVGGAASARSVQAWSFDERDPPRSLILHAQVTRTGTGVAGTAGARVACLTLAAT